MRGSVDEAGEMDCPRSAAREALHVVLSDDHNAEAGDAALREVITRVALAWIRGRTSLVIGA